MQLFVQGSGSQLRTIYSSGTTGQYMEKFLLVTAWGTGCYCMQQGEASHATQHPTVHRTDPQN